MKSILLVLITMFLLSSCANVRKQVRLTSIDRVSPGGCTYNTDIDFWDCLDKKQECYLNNNLFTEKEWEEMGDTITRNEETLTIIVTKLYDCVVKLQNEMLICTYPFTEDMLSRLSINFHVIEGKDKDKFTYILEKH
jgi:hypothetical protein